MAEMLGNDGYLNIPRYEKIFGATRAIEHTSWVTLDACMTNKTTMSLIATEPEVYPDLEKV